VADLANLKLTDAEVARFQADLDGILEHIGKLNEIDTSNVEPMAQVLYEPLAGRLGASGAGVLLDYEWHGQSCVTGEETATLRADAPATPLGNQAAMANAPQPGAGYFKVPKVIER
jgi:aspartyl-tRNA(Asn)/glutamyl-tRNA(Gln) amidotransferase subunit C